MRSWPEPGPRNPARPPDSSDSQSEKVGADPSEISQADIDALMAGAGAGAEESGSPPDSSDSQSERVGADSSEISQADIDALMNAAGSENKDDVAPVEAEAQPASDARLDTLGRPFDEAAAAMQAAIEEEKQAAANAPPPPQVPAPSLDTEAFDLPDFRSPAALGVDTKRVTMLNDVNLNVKIELGRTRMLVEDVLRLDDGSVVELDKLAGDPVDVYVNGRLIARGEVLVLNDSFCVRISDVFSRDPHRVLT